MKEKRSKLPFCAVDRARGDAEEGKSAVRGGHVRVPGCAQEVPRRARTHLRGNREQAVGQLHPPPPMCLSPSQHNQHIIFG